MYVCAEESTREATVEGWICLHTCQFARWTEPASRQTGNTTKAICVSSIGAGNVMWVYLSNAWLQVEKGENKDRECLKSVVLWLKRFPWDGARRNIDLFSPSWSGNCSSKFLASEAMLIWYEDEAPPKRATVSIAVFLLVFFQKIVNIDGRKELLGPFCKR